MDFWRKANDEERRTQQQQPLLHQKIQTQFSDFVHRMGNSLRMPWKVINDDHYALSDAEIKSRTAGIPIYMLSNYSDHQAGIFSLADSKRCLKLKFFSKPNALDFFERMKLLDDWPTNGHWRIFDAPLSDVIGSGRKGSIRLVPDSSQIKYALECDDLRLKIKTRGNTGFRTVYLRKEDLEDTMTALDIFPGNIEVASLEDIIQEMKDSSTNESNDIVFVGPGNTSNWLKV